MTPRPSSQQVHPTDSSLSVLREVEALFWSGKTREVGVAVSKINPVGLDATIGAQLAILHGMALFQLGDALVGNEKLREAVALSQNGPRSAHFSAVMALFSRESQFQAPDESLPALSRLRQLAFGLGDAVSMGSLHLEVARLEGLRGHCINARRHVEIARHLFGRVDRPTLKISLELVDSTLEMYAGNLGRAIRSARFGLDQARHGSLCMPLAGSLTNLGSLMLFSGNARSAKECLDRASELCDGLVQVRLGVVDSLAQVALFEARFQDCQGFLEQCRSISRSFRVPARTWNDLAADVTRCSYFEAIGDSTEVVAVADAADPELARRQFKAVRTSLLCAKARALARLGKHGGADAALATAVRSCPRGAVDPLIVLEASKALCFSLRGDAAKGEVHYDRALAACRAIGHRYHESWIERDRRDISRTLKSTVAVERPSRDLTDTALLLNDVATILGAGHSIDLMAHRIAAILQSTSLNARVEIQSESGREYQPEPSSVSDIDPNGVFRIRLHGSDRRVSIHVRDAHAIEEITLLKGLADLTQAAVNRTADTESEDDEQNLWPRTLVQDGDDTVFRSPRMVELLRIAVRLASTPLPVLITGETGTGKEVIARLIHQHSQVKRGPFVPFNCSAMPRDLVESQLFGHRRGAFTGAMDSFPGVIRAAERGTVFLDELADLDPATQPKFLRFLESGEVHPVGDVRPQRVSVRVVAATNADLDDLVDQGRFRRDLFYRVGVARLNLPPLRERKDEIPALAALFLDRFSRECQRTGLRPGDDFIAALLLFDWPGNIRQLANEIRRVVALAADGQTLGAGDLAPEIAEAWNSRPTSHASVTVPAVTVRIDQPLVQALAELEKKFIEHAMESSGGRVADAAQLLGISRKGLFLKRRRQGLVTRLSSDQNS
jgi:transcriptional regulator with PAS, ATPase and Fis domain